MITVYSDNIEVPVNKVVFSDGAITFKLDELPSNPRYISINVDPRTPVNEVREELLMITECINQLADDTHFSGNDTFTLNLPYLPYARNDRVFEKGNPNGLLSFLMTLGNIRCFDEIHICDIHNKGAVETLCHEYYLSFNIIEKKQLDCYKASLPYDFNISYDLVVSTDKGAMEKARTIAEHLEVDIIYASKTRNISTGRIESFDLPDNISFEGKTVLIPDDIGDGMGTFVGLAKEIKKRGAVQVDLYVTHLIAAKGLKCLTGVIDNIYCYQTVGNFVNNEDVMNFNMNKI